MENMHGKHSLGAITQHSINQEILQLEHGFLLEYMGMNSLMSTKEGNFNVDLAFFIFIYLFF